LVFRGRDLAAGLWGAKNGAIERGEGCWGRENKREKAGGYSPAWRGRAAAQQGKRGLCVDERDRGQFVGGCYESWFWEPNPEARWWPASLERYEGFLGFLCNALIFQNSPLNKFFSLPVLFTVNWYLYAKCCLL
jgi:hypothetical protein